MLAASVDFEVEGVAFTFVEAAKARALDCADVHEGVGLAVVASQEAEALLTVEELDRAGRLLAREFALRGTAAIAEAAAAAAATLLDFDDVADDLKVLSRNFSAAIDEVVGKLLPFGEALEASTLDGADVNENVFTATLLLDEAEALL